MSEVAAIYEEVLRYGAHPRQIVVGLDVDYLLARKKVEERQIAIANGAVVPRLIQLVLDIHSIFTVEYAKDMFLWMGYKAGLVPPKTGNLFEADGTRMDIAGVPLSKDQATGQGFWLCGINAYAILPIRRAVGAPVRRVETAAYPGRDRRREGGVLYHPLQSTGAIGNGRGYSVQRLAGGAMLRLREELRPFHSSVYDLATTASLPQGEEGWTDCVHYSEQIGDVIIRQILATDGN